MKLRVLYLLGTSVVASISGWAQDNTATIGKSYTDIYGFAMMDQGFNFRTIDPDWFDTMRPSRLPNFSGQYGENQNWFAGVRQSRFGTRGYYQTPLGQLKTIFEWEFFGVGVDAGQTTIRLRHAWGELGQFGGGQTWSPFMDIDVFPNSVEYWGPNGMVFFRNVQFRWTPWQKDDSNFMIALERPGASNDAGVYADRIELQGVRGRFPMPDISSHYRWAGKAGHLQASGILRRIDYDDLNRTPTRNISGTVWGWGAHLSSNWKLSKHVLRTSIVYGAGIQNYMNDAPADVGVQNDFANTVRPVKGKALPIIAMVAFLDLNWSDKYTSTIGYSRMNIDNTSGQSADSYHSGQYALTNILYHPIKEAFLGPEFQFGYKNNLGGWKTPDYKIQFSAKYNFTMRIGGN